MWMLLYSFLSKTAMLDLPRDWMIQGLITGILNTFSDLELD